MCSWIFIDSRSKSSKWESSDVARGAGTYEETSKTPEGRSVTLKVQGVVVVFLFFSFFDFSDFSFLFCHFFIYLFLFFFFFLIFLFFFFLIAFLFEFL